MNLTKEKKSYNIDDNPSAIQQWVGAKLASGQAYKAEPPDAVQATTQHSNKYEKISRDVQRSNREGKGSNLNRKRSREKQKGLTGGW